MENEGLENPPSAGCAGASQKWGPVQAPGILPLTDRGLPNRGLPNLGQVEEQVEEQEVGEAASAASATENPT